jgi:hypothetical protein
MSDGKMMDYMDKNGQLLRCTVLRYFYKHPVFGSHEQAKYYLVETESKGQFLVTYQSGCWRELSMDDIFVLLNDWVQFVNVEV